MKTNVFRSLWRDLNGQGSIMALILMATILGLGMIVGLVTLRDQIVQEFGDIGAGLESLDQSFSAEGYGEYTDDGPSYPGADEDAANQPPGGLSFE